jgi:hypothetical protein
MFDHGACGGTDMLTIRSMIPLPSLAVPFPLATPQPLAILLRPCAEPA